MTNGIRQPSSTDDSVFGSTLNNDWDVVVIGAGPAGTMAAIRTASSGLRTLIVERKPFPRFKVCGACLNQRALNAFSVAGLDPIISELPATRLSEFRVASPRTSATIPLEHASLAIARSDLDSALAIAAVDRGATFLPETAATIRPSEQPQSARNILLRRGDDSQSVQASVVIVADGLAQSSLKELAEFRSDLSRHSRIGIGGIVDIPTDDLTNRDAYGEGAIHMAVGKTGYVGVVRLADGTLNVAAACDVDALKRDSSKADMIARMLREAGMFVPNAIHSTEWMGTAGLTRTSNRVAGHRLLVVGDAGGYVEPFTGEGMAWAATSGQAAADLCVDSWADACKSWAQSTEKRWDQVHSKLVRQRQTWCRRIARLIKSPRLVNVTLNAANRFPGLVKPVLRHLNAPANQIRATRQLEASCETSRTAVGTHPHRTHSSTSR